MLIGAFDWANEGDDEAVIEPAVAKLSLLPVEEIAAFQEILAGKLHALDTEAHARSIGEYAYTSGGDGFSVDWFLSTRCCVVANGRDFFNSVVSDPSAMPKDMEFESLLYLRSGDIPECWPSRVSIAGVGLGFPSRPLEQSTSGVDSEI